MTQKELGLNQKGVDRGAIEIDDITKPELGAARKLQPAHRRFFRDDLRTARAATLSDAENFSEILFALERLGTFMFGVTASLGKYKPSLISIAEQSPLFELHGTVWGTSFENLFRVMREARNDSMHTGAYARHAANNSVLVSLILEDALMQDAETLHEFMVSEPVCAEMWHPIGLIRQKMLANSFSFLPVRFRDAEENWALVSDALLANLLRGLKYSDKQVCLATSLEAAVEAGGLDLEPARCCSSDVSIEEIKGTINQQPILLFRGDDRERLLGIVTAYDLV